MTIIPTFTAEDQVLVYHYISNKRKLDEPDDEMISENEDLIEMEEEIVEEIKKPEKKLKKPSYMVKKVRQINLKLRLKQDLSQK